MAKSNVKSRIFEKMRNSKYEEKKAERIAERERLKQEKKVQQANEYIAGGLAAADSEYVKQT